jgi:hypothetical protein
MKNLPFVKASNVEGVAKTPPCDLKLSLAPEFGGVEKVSMGMNITEVGSKVPEHTHEASEEVLFPSAGRPKLIIEGEGEIGLETALIPRLG